MNVYGRLVTVYLASGLIFLALALLRGRIDGAAVIATALILLALFTTVWTWTHRKRPHPVSTITPVLYPTVPSPLPHDHQILDDHWRAMQDIEDRIIDAIGDRYGTKSARQAIRKAFKLTVPWVLNTQQTLDDLTAGQLLAELRKEEKSIFWPLLCADPEFQTECPRCDKAVTVDKEGLCPACAHEFAEVD